MSFVFRIAITGQFNLIYTNLFNLLKNLRSTTQLITLDTSPLMEFIAMSVLLC